MKDKHTVGGKWPEIAVNKPFIIVIRFDSDYSIGHFAAIDDQTIGITECFEEIGL